jgi:hypothetical protein
MPKSRFSRSGALLFCAFAGVTLGTALAAPGFAAEFAPLFVLVALYLLGRFPGEEMIERLRERHRRRAPRATSQSHPVPRAPFVRPVGRAAGFALAVRPPPAVLLP